MNLGFDFGTLGGPEFNTTVIVLGSGYEQRNANWAQSRGRWQIGDRLYDRAELEYLITFFRAMRGAANSFRFKDWADYQGINEVVGVADNSTTQFQLTKTYAIGGQSQTRPIKKPVTGTTTVQVAGVEQTGVSVDTTTGIITFDDAPTTGNITASFEFDTPVRFEQDKFESRFDGSDGRDSVFYVSSLSVIEVRI